MTLKSLLREPITSLAFSKSIGAALGWHGQPPYQILTKSGGSSSCRQRPNSTIRAFRRLAVGQSVSACIGDTPLSPICVLTGRAAG